MYYYCALSQFFWNRHYISRFSQGPIPESLVEKKSQFTKLFIICLWSIKRAWFQGILNNFLESWSFLSPNFQGFSRKDICQWQILENSLVFMITVKYNLTKKWLDLETLKHRCSSKSTDVCLSQCRITPQKYKLNYCFTAIEWSYWLNLMIETGKKCFDHL